VLTPLLATLVLLSQAPASPAASPDEPITVLIAPPDSAGVPGHVVEFAQEHVAEQARAKGLSVKRMKDVLRKMSAAKRRSLLKCKRTELRCLTSLGAAAQTEVVLIAELLQRLDGYRVGTKVYRSVDGALVAEHLVPGVKEDGMLDALTQSLEVVVPKMRKELRPSATPDPGPPEGTGTTGTGTGTTEGTGTTGTGTGTTEGTGTTGTGTGTTEGTGTTGTGTGTTGTGTGTTGTGTGGTPLTSPTSPTVSTGSSARSWAWAPAAGGVVFAGVGTYFLLKAADKHEMLESGPGPYDAEQVAKEGRQAQTLSRVAYGIGAAGIVTGVVLFLLPSGEQSTVRPSVSVGPNGGMVGVAGTLP
jgi:hypothetical protein